MPIKTFRGKIASGAQDILSLHTNNGATGYRIVRFDLFTDTPGIGNEAEHVVKIYTVPQTAVTATVDFSEQPLVGVGFLPVKTSIFTQQQIVTFDLAVFNQDIYVTHLDNGGNSVAVNYHIELEQIKLDLNENTVATLKDIRNLS